MRVRHFVRESAHKNEKVCKGCSPPYESETLKILALIAAALGVTKVTHRLTRVRPDQVERYLVLELKHQGWATTFFSLFSSALQHGIIFDPSTTLYIAPISIISYRIRRYDEASIHGHDVIVSDITRAGSPSIQGFPLFYFLSSAIFLFFGFRNSFLSIK